MKQTHKKLLALCISACLCSAVLEGCKENSTESTAEAQVSVQTETMEAAFMEQVSSDAEQVEEKGNIYDAVNIRNMEDLDIRL